MIEAAAMRLKSVAYCPLSTAIDEVIGRSSPYSLYSEKIVTFEDDHGAYDQKDAEGFIKLNALRLRLMAGRDRKFGKN